MDIKEHKILFKKFIKQYVETGIEAFLVKASHTGDVLNIITILGQNLKLDQRQLFLAQLTALYHDLGRFIQYDKYKTFKDHLSIDHSIESVNLLQELNFLGNLPHEEQALIKLAILEHNKKNMSLNLSQSEIYLAMLIRDADKLSNFPFFLKNYDKFKVSISNYYKPEFLKFILNKTPISNTNLETIEDYYLYHLSWFNDLNYKVSIDYTVKENYISQIISKVKDLEIQLQLSTHFKNLQSDKSLYQKCNF